MGKFRDVKKTLIKMNASDEIIEYVRVQIENKNIIIDQKSKLLEVLNKKCCSIDDRYFEIKTVNSSKSKITINPCSGRLTLKVSDKCTEKVRKEYIILCNKIIMDNTIEPMTLRGNIEYRNDKYFICLQSDSKRFKKYYELESIKGEK